MTCGNAHAARVLSAPVRRILIHVSLNGPRCR